MIYINHFYHFFLFYFGIILNGIFSFSLKLTPFKLKSKMLSLDESLFKVGCLSLMFWFRIGWIGGILLSDTVFSLFLMLFDPIIPRLTMLFSEYCFFFVFYSSSKSWIFTYKPLFIDFLFPNIFGFSSFSFIYSSKSYFYSSSFNSAIYPSYP